MIDGVIFDMDGTMFDTERMWATFWEPALAALGLPYREGLAEAARGTAGVTTRNVVRQFYGPDCDAEASWTACTGWRMRCSSRPRCPKSPAWMRCWPG